MALPESFTGGLSPQLVDQYYQEFLGRAPEPGIYSQLTGASPQDLRSALGASQEFQARMDQFFPSAPAPSPVAQVPFTAGLDKPLIDQYYQEYLGRAPESGIYAQLAGASPQQLRSALGASTEFKSRLNQFFPETATTALSPVAFTGGLNKPLIDQYYQEFLGRTPEPEIYSQLTTASPQQLRSALGTSEEFKSRLNQLFPSIAKTTSEDIPFTGGLSKDLIDQYYQEYLGRTPEPNVYAQLAGASPEDLRKGLERSEEYKMRLGQVNPSALLPKKSILRMSPKERQALYESRTTPEQRSIFDELTNQYGALQNQANYRYGGPSVDVILQNQAKILADAGVKSIYDIVPDRRIVDQDIFLFEKLLPTGNFTPEGEVEYKTELYKAENGTLVPLNEYEKANVKEQDSFIPYLRTKTKVLGTMAVDKRTGKELFLHASSDPNNFTIGAFGDEGGTGRVNLTFTPEGIPVMVPIFEPEQKKKSTLEKVAPVLALAATPFIPGIGAALAPAANAAVQAAVGAAVVNAGIQLAATGQIDVGKLAISAAGSFIGANAGFTGADIAADASQLAAQGLNTGQIASTISATGVNSVTASVAATLAKAGVDATVAPIITSGVIGAGLSGLSAAASNQDISNAITTGALTGMSGQVSEFVVNDLIGGETIASIAKDVGLSENQLKSLTAMSLSNALNAEILNQGNFGEVFATNLVSGGVSFKAANQMAEALQNKVPDKARAAIVSATQEMTAIGTQAAIQNQDVIEALTQAAPWVGVKAAMTAIQTPSGTKEKPTGEKASEALPLGERAVPDVVPDPIKPTVSGIPDGSGFNTPEEAMQWAKSLGEPRVTWDGKVYQETAAKTVTGIPDGSGFTSAQDAIKWANSMGENRVVWNGQIYQNRTLTDTFNDIESSKTFGEAYSKARQALGPGVIFDWNGKKFTTDTKEENPSLAQASDRITNIQQGIGGERGTYAGYDEKEMANLLAMIDDNAINQAVARPSGEVDFITDAITGKQTPVYGDKISKDLITPVVRTVGVLTRGAGSTVDFTSGFLQSIEVIDKDSPMINLAKELTRVGEYQVGDWALDQEKQFIKKVADAEGVIDKSAALAQAIIKHPMAVITLSANEVIEELPSVLAMLATGGAGGVAKLLSLGAGGITNYMEGAGANYNETKEKALASGMSEQDAHRAAQKSALAAGATQAVLGTFAESPLIKKSFGAPKTLGTAVRREVLTEIPEEFAQTGFTDYFGTGSFDLNNALTSAVIAPVIAGTAVTAIGTTISAARSGDATVEMVNAVDPQQSSQVINQINSTLNSSTSIQDASNKIVSSLQAMGFNPEQAISIANTVATEQLVNNLAEINPEDSGLSINNINTLIGASASGNPVTLGDYIGASLTGNGEQMFVASDMVIGTKADGKLLTVGDISGALVSIDPKTGVQKTVQTDPQTGITTETKVQTNPKTNTTTDIKVTNDPNTNTTTESNVTTTTDSVVTTNVATNTNTNTTTNINTNTDTNTNTTTTTATQTDTNTNITTDITTNVQVEIDEIVNALVDDGMPVPDAIKIAVEEVTQKQSTQNAAEDLKNRRTSGTGGGGARLPLLDEDDWQHPGLRTYGPIKEFESPLETFLRQVEAREIEPQMQPRAEPKEEQIDMADYFAYGQEKDIDSILNEGMFPRFPAISLSDFAFPRMKSGGLVPAFEAGGLTGPLTVAAGKVRRDYREGDAVQGPGDGQSDDIPAMLADGEYVLDAEIVAALGNGSNKAGAELLDRFREEIRRHKRSGSLNNIPPKSKSPLQYLASAQKKASRR